MPTITIHVVDHPDGLLTVLTTATAPIPGARLSRAQALGLQMLTTAGRETPHVHYWQRRDKALDLVQDLLDPDGFGYAVTQEVRNAARTVLGVPHPTDKGAL